MNWLKVNGLSAFNVFLFFFVIYIARSLAVYYSSVEIKATFAASFIEWFGVLYGILLPLILVRVWEQLDEIDREFDREADVVRIFYEDLSFLQDNNDGVRKEIVYLLRSYVRHVTKRYHLEVKVPLEKRKYPDNYLHRIGFRSRNSAMELKTTSDSVRKIGDNILIEIRKQFHKLFNSDEMKTPDAEFVIKELFQKLNEIVDIRGDRISIASQRLFETLRNVALITSLMFLAPFYVVGYSEKTGVLDNLLILGLTLLVVFMYMIIEDFDEPFGGTWKIDDESWRLVRQEMVLGERQYQIESRNKVTNIINRQPRRHRQHRSGYLRRHNRMISIIHLKAYPIKQIKPLSEQKHDESKETEKDNSVKIARAKPLSSKQKRQQKTRLPSTQSPRRKQY